jgi:hypothetical protein
MATDEDYMAFLDKANQDPNEGYAKPASTSAGGKKLLKAMDDGAEVPAAIKEVTSSKDQVYTSDSDEPFEPVVLAWNEAGKTLPDEGEFPLSLTTATLHPPCGFGPEAIRRRCGTVDR